MIGMRPDFTVRVEDLDPRVVIELLHFDEVCVSGRQGQIGGRGLNSQGAQGLRSLGG